MELVVLFGLLLPALVSAKVVLFSRCGNGVSFSDPLMQTQEGINILNSVEGMRVVAWSPDSKDKDSICHRLSIADNTLNLQFLTTNGITEASGPVEVFLNNGLNNYIEIDTRKGTKMPDNMFGSGRDGKIRMYIQHLSNSELTFMTCRNGFISSIYQYYVFSALDYKKLDEECMLQSSGRWASFDMEIPRSSWNYRKNHRMTLLRVVLGLVLVVLASARYSFLGYCSSGEFYSDPFIMTQEGLMMLTELTDMKLIGLSSMESPDWMYACQSIKFTPEGRNISIEFKGTFVNGSEVEYGAKGPVSENNYMIKATKIDGVEPFPEGVLNAKSDGSMNLYVSYLSATELVLMSCKNSFLGSNRDVYIFSNSTDDLKLLDEECMSETVSSLTGNGGFTFNFMWDEMESC
ncbi:hypothetical protein FHG87_007075 [Trinorchestia longiramus]|nr:hypothetical protein FHG87_007075 [Trinorchestia longiramus]